MTKKTKPRTYDKECQMNAVNLVKRTGCDLKQILMHSNSEAVTNEQN
jgi:hypothetical protein